MVRLIEEAQRRFTPDPGARRGRDRVLSVIDQYLVMLHSDSSELRVFLRSWAATAGNDEPSLENLFTERDSFFPAYFEDAIMGGQTEGSVRADLDPAGTAIALIGLIRGIAMQALYDRRVAEDEWVR